jgi:hypothetical protein
MDVKEGVSVDQGVFSGRDEAVALIAADGRTVRDGAMSAGDLEDHHWHRTSLKIYVLSGAFETLDVVSGSTLMAYAGDLITIPERTLHAARCPEPATYVVGFESLEAMANFRPERPEAIDQP